MKSSLKEIEKVIDNLDLKSQSQIKDLLINFLKNHLNQSKIDKFIGDYPTFIEPVYLEENVRMAKTDPITVATIWHFMQRVCVEMRQTIERTATTAFATSLHDLAYGIWDAEGRAIAIPEGFPCRLVSSSFPIRAVLKRFTDQIYPGDVFLTNHPFKAGAVHLPD